MEFKCYLLLPIILLSACNSSKDKSVVLESELQTEFQYSQTMPKGGVVADEERGEQVWFGLTALTGVEETIANGVAQTFIFEDGSTQHGLQLNIERAEDGFFYEGWLVDPLTNDVINTGHLRTLFGDVRHALQFADTRDLRSYTKVVVTLEPDDGDPAPAAHAAEGILKEIKR